MQSPSCYNYDKIIDNYAAIRELQTVVEGKIDKQRLVLKNVQERLEK